jgi:diguanylate cyclase (GGDEF)-like protein
VTERKRLEQQLLELARTDSLTGLANRRSFDEVLAAEWHRAVRTGSSLTLVILDVDRFKLFNDAYGHRAGDSCLQVVAGAIRGAASRPGDLVARYGGEEIALLLPGTDLVVACRIAEVARRAVQDLAQVHTPNVPFGVVTASAGVATFQMRAGRGGELRPADLIEAADRALYVAKQDGRNRIVAAPVLREGAEQAPRRAA